MKKFELIIFIFLLIYLFNCKHEYYEIEENNVYGKWKWVETCGGFNYTCNDDKKSSFSEIIEFKKDNSFKSITNDTIESTSTFYLKDTVSFDKPVVRIFFNPENKFNGKIIYIKNEEILFSI